VQCAANSPTTRDKMSAQAEPSELPSPDALASKPASGLSSYQATGKQRCSCGAADHPLATDLVSCVRCDGTGWVS